MQKLSRFFLKIRHLKTFEVLTGRVSNNFQKESRFFGKGTAENTFVGRILLHQVRIHDFSDPFQVK